MDLERAGQSREGHRWVGRMRPEVGDRQRDRRAWAGARGQSLQVRMDFFREGQTGRDLQVDHLSLG